MSIGREELYRIIDEIPEGELPGVHRYLEYVRDVGADPVRHALDNAPLDDEPRKRSAALRTRPATL